MKRILAILLVMGMLCLPATAQSSLKYVTDFAYATIRSGGTDGAFVYGAYENNGATYKMGLLTEYGEQSRTNWTAEGWNALFAPSEWVVTVHEDAGALCPYASSHKETTLCPYLDVALVTLTHRESGAILREQYMAYPKKTVSDGSSLSVCFGRYGFRSPETLKYSGNGTRAALRNAQGLWGVYDARSDTMLTDYVYADMSAVYGEYVKVSDGTSWGRLDLSGATATTYIYASEEVFSVTEELRSLGDDRYRVFNADNEPISAVYTLEATSVTYSPQAHTVLCVYDDGTRALLDLFGATVASFDQTQKVLYLDRACYAIEQYNNRGAVVGVALAQITNGVTPEQTVKMGDINFDGVCDSADARLALKKTMDLMRFTDRQMLAAELTADGKINTADVRALMVKCITV